MIRFGHSVVLFSVVVFFLPERLLAPLSLQNGEPSTTVVAYKRRLCSDWTPCYKRALRRR